MKCDVLSRYRINTESKLNEGHNFHDIFLLRPLRNLRGNCRIRLRWTRSFGLSVLVIGAVALRVFFPINVSVVRAKCGWTRSISKPSRSMPNQYQEVTESQQIESKFECLLPIWEQPYQIITQQYWNNKSRMVLRLEIQQFLPWHSYGKPYFKYPPAHKSGLQTWCKFSICSSVRTRHWIKVFLPFSQSEAFRDLLRVLRCCIYGCWFLIMFRQKWEDKPQLLTSASQSYYYSPFNYVCMPWTCVDMMYRHLFNIGVIKNADLLQRMVFSAGIWKQISLEDIALSNNIFKRTSACVWWKCK